MAGFIPRKSGWPDSYSRHQGDQVFTTAVRVATKIRPIQRKSSGWSASMNKPEKPGFNNSHRNQGDQVREY